MCDHCSCREVPAVARMSEEHERILALAWQVAERQASPAQLAELLDLFDRHVRKEELGLYPGLLDERALTDGSRDTLEAEHGAVRSRLVDGGFDRNWYYALAAHVEEEELELFPLAMLRFDDELWNRVEALEAVPGVTVG